MCLCVRLLGIPCPWIVPGPQPLWDVQPRGDEIKGRSGLNVVGSEPNLLAMLTPGTTYQCCSVFRLSWFVVEDAIVNVMVLKVVVVSTFGYNCSCGYWATAFRA